MSYGFALSMRLLPSPFGLTTELNNAAPSLQPHYRAFTATTGSSYPHPHASATEDSRACARPASSGSQRRTLDRPVPPEPDGLVADVDPALSQEILHVAHGQRVSHVHHHDQTDDLW